MSASVSLVGLGVATAARCDARPADMDPSAREALSLARLASAEPDAEIAVDAWDEAVRLAAAAADAGAPLSEETVSLWLAARADCLASLRRWADAERAYGDAAEALARVVAAQVTVAGTGGRIDSDEASVPMYARLAMAHDGQALAAGAIDDWPAAVEASRRAAAAAGLGGSGRSVDVPTTAFKAGMREGRGSITFAEGAVYEGRFREDHLDGQGTIKVSSIVPGCEEGEKLIPIEIQADIRRIHLKAGFGAPEHH